MRCAYMLFKWLQSSPIEKRNQTVPSRCLETTQSSAGVTQCTLHQHQVSREYLSGRITCAHSLHVTAYSSLYTAILLLLILALEDPISIIDLSEVPDGILGDNCV